MPATLSLTLGTPATFGAFTPGVAQDYTASTTANVISTAGDATLSVADPSSTSTGSGQRDVLAAASRWQAFAPSAEAPTLKTWSARSPTSRSTINFKQSIEANDALRTGAYCKTLTFTLSTTTP